MESAPRLRLLVAAFVVTTLISGLANAQEPGGRGRRRFRGFGGPGGFNLGRTTKLVKDFDKDENGRLDADERKAARAHLAEERENGRGGRRRFGRGPRRGRGGNSEPPKPGEKVAVGDVEEHPDAALYDPAVVRTFFLEFESADWEKELEDFNNTDVEVPARLTVDGKTYENVGVHFRGMSSFMMVGEGRKRSLNLSLDFVEKRQRLHGYRTLNLLNSHSDPTLLHAVLFSQIARRYIPAPKANFARVVINGESWGIYVNAQQFNKDLVRDWFATGKGARWKAPGSPGGRASFAYLGDDVEQYKSIYSIRSKDKPESWQALINLCKVLDETPADELEKALEPILDVDGALEFLALENVFVNHDGYWVRTSDYNLYLDVDNRFHIVPHDTNETFSAGGGFGPPGGFAFPPGGPPGGFGGPDGPGGAFPPGGGFPGAGFPGGFPGFGGFGRGMTARHMLARGDANDDGELSKDELGALVGGWFDAIDKKNAGKLDAETFVSSLGAAFFPESDKDAPRPDGPIPDGFIALGMFAGADADRDGSVTRDDLVKTFEKWFDGWDEAKRGSVDEGTLADGLREAFPRPQIRGFGPPDGGGNSEEARDDRERRDDPAGADRQQDRGGRQRGRRGRRGRRGGPGQGGVVRLDPLTGADDDAKPLISKLLAVPALRERYLGHVRELAEKWLDWERLGPMAKRHHALIADYVRADTRKIDSTEDFEGAIDESGGGRTSIKTFADQRREYLLKRLAEIAIEKKE